MSLELKTLRCEYLINPLGIDVLNPRLSWILESKIKGACQTAYKILVASEKSLLNEDKGDLWDTNKVISNKMNQIVYKGRPLKSRMICYWKVQVWDTNDKKSKWSEIKAWSMGLLNEDDWKGNWIGLPTRKNKKGIRRIIPKRIYRPSPYIRKDQEIKKSLKKAIMYVSALGEYECYVNGKRVGKDFLAPEWTDYYKRVQYQTFDVSALINGGELTIGAILGDGWYRGRLGPFGLLHDYYGSNLRLLMQLELEFNDGTSEIICTDHTWKIFDDGPIRESDHFRGEIYDCRKELNGWNTSDFDDSHWSAVTIDDSINVNLVAQMNEPIRIVKEIKPIDVFKTSKGTFIFDLGQNIAGWCKLRINERYFNPNTKITLKHAEILTNRGKLYTRNLRLIRAREKYILAGVDERELRPHFTYHGFQYIEVKGLKKGVIPDLDMITGCVIASDSPVVGEFKCSNVKLNKLWNNILWTQRDNMISVPTDCPQRGERMGWMGDNTAFCQTAIYNMDMAAFYSKWVLDMRDAQGKEGTFPDFVPFPRSKLYKSLGLFCAPGWADCGIILPWTLYLNYDDRSLINHHYESAKNFINYVHEKNPDLIWVNGIRNNYGDWLNGDNIKLKDYPKNGSEVPKDVFATIFFAHSTELLSKMAKLLDLTEDANYYSNLAQDIRKRFNERFVDENGIIKGDTQSGYALALHFNILHQAKRSRAIANLINVLNRYENRISTGFLSTLPLMLELVKQGHEDIAYELLFSERTPSWFYMIEQGATTMWERWDSYIKERGVQSSLMNSFNHFAIGSIGEWLYRVILGINLDENEPGYRHVIIKPIPYHRLVWAEGSYNSIHGKISVKWKLEDKRFELAISIPVNITATVILKAKEEHLIKEGGLSIKGSNEIKLIKYDNNWAHLKVGSGDYKFNTEFPQDD